MADARGAALRSPEIQAALARDLARRLRENPLRWIVRPNRLLPDLFEWMPRQREAIAAQAGVKLFLFGAGNRAGKTEWATRWFLGQALGLDYRSLHERESPPRDWELGPPKLLWAVTTTLEKSRTMQQKVLSERLPPALRRSRYHPASGYHNRVMTLRNGTRIIFKSAEQRLVEFESDSVHAVWIDEFIPLHYVSALLIRTTETNGPVVWTTWPGEMELHDVFVRRQMYPGAEGLLRPGDVGAVFGGMADNVYLTPEQVALQQRLANPDERAGRIFGRFTFKQDLVYPAYGEAHRESVELPVPRDWTLYESIDPGWDNPCCVLFGGVDGRGVRHAYDEIYRRGRTVGQIAAEVFVRRWQHRGLLTPQEIAELQALIEQHGPDLDAPDAFEAELRRNAALRRVIDAWRAVKGDCAPYQVLMDEAGRQRDQAKPVSVHRQFAEFGIHASLASNRDEEGMRARVREALAPLDGVPRLMIDRRCAFGDYELRHYKHKVRLDGLRPEGDREQVRRRDDHFISCLEYWLAADPRWRPPDERERDDWAAPARPDWRKRG